MYIFIAIGAGVILIVGYLVISTFLAIVRTTNETKILASYSCGVTELRLMHNIKDSFDHQSESLYFEFQKNGTATRTHGIELTSNGWSPSPYYSLADMRTFPGYSPDYVKKRMWNISLDADHTLFSEIADCVEKHHQDINKRLQSIKPTLDNAQKLSGLNLISTNKGDLEFTCGQESEQNKIYRITMVGGPSSYKPKIEVHDPATYSSDYALYPFGYWLITAPAPKGNDAEINDLRSCRNYDGETFGEYLDAFNSFAARIKFSEIEASTGR